MKKEKDVGSPADFAPSCLMGCGAAVILAAAAAAIFWALGWVLLQII